MQSKLKEIQYEDFDTLATAFNTHKKTKTILLSAEAATILANSKQFFIKKDTLDKESCHMFSHDIVKLKQDPNTFYIMSTCRGKGSFGAVYQSSLKITVSSEKSLFKTMYTAHLSPVECVIKIQKLRPQDKLNTVLKSVCKEAKNLQEHEVKVIDVIPDTDKIITIMEDCGISLEKIIEKKVLDFNERLRIASCLASELHLLQKNEKVHRDLKPQNICIREKQNQLQAIFIDFGLAEDIDHIRKEELAGTYPYIAPELFSFREKASYASDCFSYAIILGQLLGAHDIFRLKQDACKYSKTEFETWTNFANAPLHLEGIFTGYKSDGIDQQLKKDIILLIEAMHHKNPEKRPKINLIEKFLALIPARQRAYEQYKKNANELKKTYNEYQELCKHIDVDLRSVAHPFKGALIPKHNTIQNLITSLKKISFQSHLNMTHQILTQNRTADLENDDNPFPDLKPALMTINQEILKINQALQHFNENTKAIANSKRFDQSNSTGIRKIITTLHSNTLSPFEKLKIIQHIGAAKKSDHFFAFNWWSRLHFFNKGRHAGMEVIYQKCQALKSESDDYFANQQLEELKDFIANEKNVLTWC